MTNTISDFGREMDSLADVITFGIAPAILAYVWGVHFVSGAGGRRVDRSTAACRKIRTFLFSSRGRPAGAFQRPEKSPIPRNPGKPHRKYFVGLAIPAGAGMVAALVYAFDSYPITSFYWSALWLVLLACSRS